MAKGRGSKGGRKGLSSEQLKRFRHEVSQLKKLGGVSKRVDARKQRPTQYMLGKVRKLQPVLRGEAVLVKRSALRPDLLADYTRTNPRVGSRLMIGKRQDERVKIVRGMPQLERTIGQTGTRRVVQRRIPLPIDIHNLDEFIVSLNMNPDFWTFERGDYPPWLFGYTLFGGRSSQLFVEPEGMAAALNEYRKFEDPEWQDEAWDSFILYAVDQENIGSWSGESVRKARRQKLKGKRTRKPLAGYRKIADMDRKRRERARESESKADERRRKNAERMANKRTTLSKAAMERVRKYDRQRKFDERRELGFKMRVPKPRPKK